MLISKFSAKFGSSQRAVESHWHWPDFQFTVYTSKILLTVLDLYSFVTVFATTLMLRNSLYNAPGVIVVWLASKSLSSNRIIV